MDAAEPELVVKVALSIEGCHRQELLHDLSRTASLAQHIAALHSCFGGSSALGLNSEDLSFFVPAHARYLTEDQWVAGVAHQHNWVMEGCTLHLSLSPQRRAAEMVLLFEDFLTDEDYARNAKFSSVVT